MISNQQEFKMLILLAVNCSYSRLKLSVISRRQTRGSEQNFHLKFQKLSKQTQDQFKPDSRQGKDFIQFHLGLPRKLATQTIVTLPNIPDKIFKCAEGDHPAHPLARWSE